MRPALCNLRAGQAAALSQTSQTAALSLAADHSTGHSTGRSTGNSTGRSTGNSTGRIGFHVCVLAIATMFIHTYIQVNLLGIPLRYYWKYTES